MLSAKKEGALWGGAPPHSHDPSVVDMLREEVRRVSSERDALAGRVGREGQEAAERVRDLLEGRIAELGDKVAGLEKEVEAWRERAAGVEGERDAARRGRELAEEGKRKLEGEVLRLKEVAWEAERAREELAGMVEAEKERVVQGETLFLLRPWISNPQA